jgi:hypothetical protein
MPDDDEHAPYIADEHVRYVTVGDILTSDAYHRLNEYRSTAAVAAEDIIGYTAKYKPRHAYDKRDPYAWFSIIDVGVGEPFRVRTDARQHG